jgi:hypothetical protein
VIVLIPCIYCFLVRKDSITKPDTPFKCCVARVRLYLGIDPWNQRRCSYHRATPYKRSLASYLYKKAYTDSIRRSWLYSTKTLSAGLLSRTKILDSLATRSDRQGAPVLISLNHHELHAGRDVERSLPGPQGNSQIGNVGRFGLTGSVRGHDTPSVRLRELDTIRQLVMFAFRTAELTLGLTRRSFRFG